MKLQTKLIAGFVAIVLMMGISQSLFLQSKIEATFEAYLEQYNFGFMERMEQTLTTYYQEMGSWDNVQSLFFSGDSGMGHGQGRGMMRGIGMNMMALANADLLLVDQNGVVVADTSGTRLGENGEDFVGATQELMIAGEKQGSLVLYQYRWQSFEEDFLKSANLAIVLSSLLVAGLAVLIGIFVARKITKPLRKLMEGIGRIAGGERSTKVKIATKDEFHELGEAFNHMSEKLAQNEEARQALVADVAHELRTPLAILQGKLESIQEGAIAPSEEVVLELTDEVYRLNRLVSDLQQLSLAEAGKLPLSLQRVNFKDLVERICGNLQWLADEKGITLLFERIPDDCWMEMDADRITQVMVNLVGNALRHSGESGTVEVSVEDYEHAIVMKVSDDGPGIPEDVLPFIFDRFYKRDSARSRSEGGTGLGLSIAKGFIEAHGGRISVESEVGKGTVFTVKLNKERDR